MKVKRFRVVDHAEPAIDDLIAAVGRVRRAIVSQSDRRSTAEGLQSSLGMFEADRADLDGDRAAGTKSINTFFRRDHGHAVIRGRGDDFLAQQRHLRVL